MGLDLSLLHTLCCLRALLTGRLLDPGASWAALFSWMGNPACGAGLTFCYWMEGCKTLSLVSFSVGDTNQFAFLFPSEFSLCCLLHFQGLSLYLVKRRWKEWILHPLAQSRNLYPLGYMSPPLNSDSCSLRAMMYFVSSVV